MKKLKTVKKGLTARRRKLTQAQRKQEILDAAIKIAEKNGYLSLKREIVAEVSGASSACVSWYFNPIKKLIHAVLEEALAQENLSILIQAVSNGDKKTIKALDANPE